MAAGLDDKISSPGVVIDYPTNDIDLLRTVSQLAQAAREIESNCEVSMDTLLREITVNNQPQRRVPDDPLTPPTGAGCQRA